MNGIKKILSVMLVLTLLLSFTTIALASGTGKETGTVEGENDVDNVAIEIDVPTNIDFTLDPLELSSIAGGQVAGTAFVFENFTEAPVKLVFDIEATLASGVSLVASPSALAKDDDTETSKKIYFGAIGATSITGTGPYTIGYGTEPADTLSVFDVTDGTATIAFALDKSPDGDELAANGKGVAAWQFYGELNTYADWQDADVTVEATYTFTALRAATYTGYQASDFVTGGVNQLASGSSNVITAHVTAVSSTTVNYSGTVLVDTANSNSITTPSGGLTVVLTEKPANITSLTDNGNVRTLGTHYAYDATTGILTIQRTGSIADLKTIVITAGGNTYTVTFTATHP